MALNEIRVPLGIIASICTTGAFLPQVFKIRRNGGRDLSYTMLGIYLTGILLWLWYGFVIHDAAVILANSATAFLVGLCIVLKWKAERKEHRSEILNAKLVNAKSTKQTIRDSVPEESLAVSAK